MVPPDTFVVNERSARWSQNLDRELNHKTEKSLTPGGGIVENVDVLEGTCRREWQTDIASEHGRNIDQYVGIENRRSCGGKSKSAFNPVKESWKNGQHDTPGLHMR